MPESGIATPYRQQRHHLDAHADQLQRGSVAAGAPDDLLVSAEVADWLRVSIKWLEACRSSGIGPSYLKLGRRCVYRRSDVLAWLDQRAAASARR